QCSPASPRGAGCNCVAATQRRAMSVSKKELKRSWPWHLPGESLRVWRKRATRVLEELRTKLAKTDAELQAEQEEARKAAWEADRKRHEERMAGFQFTSSVTPEQRAEQAQQEAKHLRQSEIDRIEEREAERKVALEIINAGFRALSARHARAMGIPTGR